jgi:hypothetical protein
MVTAIVALLLSMVRPSGCAQRYGARAERVCPVAWQQLQGRKLRRPRRRPRGYVELKLLRYDEIDRVFRPR